MKLFNFTRREGRSNYSTLEEENCDMHLDKGELTAWILG
jgi:hypothetical protein